MDSVLEKQREFFKSGVTLNLNFRIECLKMLEESIYYNMND